jgi:uncharacterized protein YndB with AHSA1/START domain
MPDSTTTSAMTEPIVREVHIDATPEVVFEFFVDRAKITRWLAVEATLDPRPGGVCHQVHEATDGQRYDMRGEFVEVVPPCRVVFTWGFVSGGGVAPGSSTVDVTLTPDGRGTHVRLVHRDLPTSAVGDHAGGWTTMLDRLVTAVSTREGA